MIPAHLHADLSPLLVRAGEWPDARALSVVPPWLPPAAPSAPADETGRLAAARPVPPELELDLDALLASVGQLVRPDLRSGPLARHLYWTADRALYFRLRAPGAGTSVHTATSDAGGSSDTRHALPGAGRLGGWASFAPTAGGVQAFCLYGHRRRGREEPASDARAVLLPLVRELVTPGLADELAGIRPHPAPAVSGPGDHAAIFRLDPAGYGVAYSYVYAYTNGERVVAAVQPLIHHVA